LYNTSKNNPASNRKAAHFFELQKNCLYTYLPSTGILKISADVLVCILVCARNAGMFFIEW